MQDHVLYAHAHYHTTNVRAFAQKYTHKRMPKEVWRESPVSYFNILNNKMHEDLP